MNVLYSRHTSESSIHFTYVINARIKTDLNKNFRIKIYFGLINDTEI